LINCHYTLKQFDLTTEGLYDDIWITIPLISSFYLPIISEIHQVFRIDGNTNQLAICQTAIAYINEIV